MKAQTTLLNIFCILILISITSCKEKTPKENSLFASIELEKGDLVQETFDLALDLLHYFKYNEAKKGFIKILDADTMCNVYNDSKYMTKIEIS